MDNVISPPPRRLPSLRAKPIAFKPENEQPVFPQPHNHGTHILRIIRMRLPDYRASRHGTEPLAHRGLPRSAAPHRGRLPRPRLDSRRNHKGARAKQPGLQTQQARDAYVTLDDPPRSEAISYALDISYARRYCGFRDSFLTTWDSRCILRPLLGPSAYLQDWLGLLLDLLWPLQRNQSLACRRDFRRC